MSDMPPGRPVRGGGLTFWTADPFLIAAVERCAVLEAERDIYKNIVMHSDTARYRTLRRDVRQIKRGVDALRRPT